MPWKVLKGYEPTTPSFNSSSGIGFIVSAASCVPKQPLWGRNLTGRFSKRKGPHDLSYGPFPVVNKIQEAASLLTPPFVAISVIRRSPS